MKAHIIIFLVCIRLTGFSCECPPLEPISKKISESYDVIFHAKIDSLKPCSTDGAGTAYFTIISLYKGSAEQHISVEYDCSSSCMMSMSKGEEWIIYAMYIHFDKLKAELCSHSRKRITDGTMDFYQAASQRTFDEENEFLHSALGTKEFAKHNPMNDTQQEMRPQNEQPNAMSKLWLLLISVAVLGIIYLITKKYFRNDR